jgi:hypothetical protein
MMTAFVGPIIESGGFQLPVKSMFLKGARQWTDLKIATILIIKVSDASTGVTGRKHIVRYIVCDHTAGTNHGSRSDMDTRANDRPTANPNIRANFNRPGGFEPSASFRRAYGVSGSIHLHRRTE